MGQLYVDIVGNFDGFRDVAVYGAMIFELWP